MHEDLPVHVDSLEGKGTITYATEVISTIVGVATTEVEGITSMAGSATISELLSGRPKNLSRGVKVEVGAEEVAVDVSVIVDYGMPIQVVGRNVQENIRKSIETMTGLHIIKVDVHVLGVSFEKENKELEQGQEMARLQSGQAAPSGYLESQDAITRPAREDGDASMGTMGSVRVELVEDDEPAASSRKRGRGSKKVAPERDSLRQEAPKEPADEPAESAKAVEAAGDDEADASMSSEAADASVEANQAEETADTPAQGPQNAEESLEADAQSQNPKDDTDTTAGE
jgi:uncharacterized alkaline shock family protein YloU